jgi:hypothetical protein
MDYIVYLGQLKTDSIQSVSDRTVESSSFRVDAAMFVYKLTAQPGQHRRRVIGDDDD